MKFDRGFIKWQPFNSVISNTSILKSLQKEQNIIKPELFPEEQEILMNQISDAYYSKSKIKMQIYENNKIKVIETSIQKINSPSNTLVIEPNHTISFNQILHIF